MELDLITEIMTDGKELIYFSKDTIYESLMEHYLNGREKEKFITFVGETLKNNRKLKLIDGTYLESVGTYHPIVMFMNRNVDAVIKALDPDMWRTPEEEQYLPDFLRIDFFGVRGREKVIAVEEKLKLRCSLKEYIVK